MTLEELIERNQKQGMTLAEVLIAVMALGVVAALTIPAIIAQKDRREWTSALNKSYTVLANGFKNSESLNGKAEKWTQAKFIENFMEGFKILRACSDNDCVPEESYLNGEEVSLPEGAVSYELADGQIMTINVLSAGCDYLGFNLDGVCGTLYVDINGIKKPNTWGKDYFGFYITKEGIIPFGTQKIDTLKEGFEWVSDGCNNNKIICAEGKEFSCSNADNDEVVCNTCTYNGNWTVYSRQAYSTPNMSMREATYKPDAYKASEWETDTWTEKDWEISGWTPDTWAPSNWDVSAWEEKDWVVSNWTEKDWVASEWKISQYGVDQTVHTYSSTRHEATAYYPQASGCGHYSYGYYCSSYTSVPYTYYYYTYSWTTTTYYKATAYAPKAYKASTYTPAAYKASTYTPSAYTASAYSAAAYKPSAYKPSTYTPATYKPKAFVPASFVVDTPAHEYVSSYTYHEAIYNTSCPEAPAKVCLGYRYDKQWDCWQENGSQLLDDCNAINKASKTSCNAQVKEIDALKDCNLDDKGTSCAAWTIFNGNMIYLDGKEVSW